MFGLDTDTLLIILIGIAVFATLFPVIVVSIGEKKKGNQSEKKDQPKVELKGEKAETRDSVKAILEASKKK